jgi:hypothetical protein
MLLKLKYVLYSLSGHTAVFKEVYWSQSVLGSVPVLTPCEHVWDTVFELVINNAYS